MYALPERLLMVENYWLAVIRRQILLTAIVLASGLVLTVLVILLAPRKYQSEARLLLRLGRENVSLDPTVTTAGDAMSFHQTRDNEINTLLEAMKSRNVLETVVDQIGEKNILRGSSDLTARSGSILGGVRSSLSSVLANIDPMDDRERAILDLQRGISIDAGRQSSVIKIQYITKTSELAQAVTTAWVDAYLREHASMNSTVGSLAFFEREEEQLRQSMQTARDHLRTVKSKFGIVTIAGKQTNLESQLQWASGMVVQSRAALAAAQAKLNSFARLRDQTSETIVTSEIKTDNNDAQNQMRNRLYELEIEERRLASVYTKEHPAYRVVEKQLQEAKQVYQSQQNQSGEVTQGINPLHTAIMQQWTELISQVAAHEAELESTQNISIQLQDDLVELNTQEAEIAVLGRDVEVLETQYRVHFEKYEQARLASDMRDSSISNINVIQPASLQRRPVSPNKMMCGLLGMTGSLFAAIGVALLRESHHDRRGGNIADEPIRRRKKPLTGEGLKDSNENSDDSVQIEYPDEGFSVRHPLHQ